MSEDKNPNVTVIPAGHPRAEQVEIEMDREQGERNIRVGKRMSIAGISFLVATVAIGCFSIAGGFKQNASLQRYEDDARTLMDISLVAGFGLQALGGSRQQVGQLQLKHANFRQKILTEKVDKQIATKEQTTQVS
jgi:hypothetical protein